MMREIDAYTGEKYGNAKIDAIDLVSYTPIYEQIEKASKNVKTILTILIFPFKMVKNIVLCFYKNS